MKRLLPIFIICNFLFTHTYSQSLAINTDGSSAQASAMLDIKSTTKGLLIPRLTKTEKNAVTTPATGLLIFQTGPDSTGFYYYQNGQWNWITDNKRSDSSYWGLNGNNNTNPPPNFPYGVYNYTYLGTPDAKDVSLVAGGNELVRLKQFSLGGRIGMSNQNPEYSLDIRTTENTVSTAINGMRIIPKELYDYNSNNNMDKGFVIGNDPFNMTENIIWNHSSNLTGVIHIGLSNYDQTVRPAISINQYGEGIYQRYPKYALDIHSRSQFVPATTSTNKNGVRVTYLNQENQNQEDRGLFMGVGVNNTFKSYLWNYADGQSGNSPDKAIYFGVGPDMDYSSYLATMELQDGKITMGHITAPNFFFPSTLNIQTDYSSGVAKNGLSIMKHLVTQESAYFGTDDNDNLNIFKYGGGSIYLGSTLENPVTINSSNFVGIRTLTPNAELQFGDTYANNKIVLHNNLWGNFPNNEHNFYGFGVNPDVLRYQVPKSSADHVFYSGNNANTASVELMRITGDGFVGINNNNPQAPLEFANTAANRKIVLMSSANNDHNFLGFGTTGGDLRYQIPFGNFAHVFFAGDGGGGSSTELMKLKGTGELGIGINNPTYRLEVNGRMKIHSGGANATSAGIWFNNNANNTLTGFVGMENDNSIGFYGTGTPNGWGMVMEISTGNVGIGTSSPSQKLHVLGNILATGTITPSDRRYKKNIQPVENALAKLQQLNGVTYEMNRQAFPEWNFEDTRQYGLIAQEVEKVFPEMVKQINADGYKGIDYVKLIPVLIEGIKALNEKIDQQQKQIELLKMKK
ncbi:MAG: tail fiber domain-containing protein [Chitinophagaceae bacterium]|nr:tail fiber domain-containing protein [Chitinophagaceae bacterium]